jgi:hypothetical protein
MFCRFSRLDFEEGEAVRAPYEFTTQDRYLPRSVESHLPTVERSASRPEAQQMGCTSAGAWLTPDGGEGHKLIVPRLTREESVSDAVGITTDSVPEQKHSNINLVFLGLVVFQASPPGHDRPPAKSLSQ